MVKINGSNIEIDGDFEVVVAELMSANIELVGVVAKRELEAGKIDEKDLKNRKIELLHNLLGGCVKYIEEE